MVNKKEYNKQYYLKNKEKILKRRKQKYSEKKKSKEKINKILKEKRPKKTTAKRIRRQSTISLKIQEEEVRKREKALAEKIKGKKIESYFEISAILTTSARNKLIIEYTSENEEGEELKATTTSDSLIGVKDLEILKRELATIIEEGEELTESEIKRIIERISNETGFKGIYLQTAKEKGTVKINKIRIQTNVERTKNWR